MTTTDSSPVGQAPPVPLPIDVTTVAHLQGPFAPVIEETDVTDLPVEGELPPELDGVYLRNGPNPRFTPLGSYVYPLEGDGMVHGMWLSDGRARYAKRLVQTEALRAAEKDRESTRLDPRHAHNSYAALCLQKKKKPSFPT